MMEGSSEAREAEAGEEVEGGDEGGAERRVDKSREVPPVI